MPGRGKRYSKYKLRPSRFHLTRNSSRRQITPTVFHHRVVKNFLLSRSGILPKTSSSILLCARKPFKKPSPSGRSFFSSIDFSKASRDSCRDAGINVSTPLASLSSAFMKHTRTTGQIRIFQIERFAHITNHRNPSIAI